MITVRKKLEQMLFEMGMFENQATKVVELAMPEIQKMQPVVAGEESDEQAEPYQVKWNNPSDQYPPGIYGLWFIKVKEVALKWIDENCPQAWFRELFVSK